MLSTTFLITALAASLQVSAGPAVPRSEQGNLTMRVDFDLWAQFCNDKACSEGCDNPSCLNENGRQSIMFHGDTSALGDYALVV
ncbi:hypothetical protein B0H19DRAFT_1250884 [Mycena capillaripes]|nr:hypothetical protein B0H19DRAFT_1250884 [Mycena capillaripes]